MTDLMNQLAEQDSEQDEMRRMEKWISALRNELILKDKEMAETITKLKQENTVQYWLDWLLLICGIIAGFSIGLALSKIF
ncbi:MAG: hypothetical protein LBJ00_15295 [Planctomycetaceae bacterium]|jgi:hypothetical protein|nr:hypothetical protein [Planctomycetaceae bacterium]